MIRLGIIEDHQDSRDVLTAFFANQLGFEVILAAESVEAFLAELDLHEHKMDVLLLDINLPGITGIEGIKGIKSKLPKTDIIMLTLHEDSRHIFQALCAGAVGYLVKGTPLPKIKAAVESVQSGGSAMSPQVARKVVDYFQPAKQNQHSPLTPKENQIVEGLVDGLSYKLIADRYSIGIETVRTHIKNIYKKLHVNSKSEVVAKKLRGEIP
ncbi:MAG: response regulator transcription factor [Bacteroidota bacterium]